MKRKKKRIKKPEATSPSFLLPYNGRIERKPRKAFPCPPPYPIQTV